MTCYIPPPYRPSLARTAITRALGVLAFTALMASAFVAVAAVAMVLT